MNTNTLEIKIYDEINIIDVFCYVEKVIKIEFIYELPVFNYVLDELFNNINNYSNPPNNLKGTKLDESLKFSFAFVHYN